MIRLLTLSLNDKQYQSIYMLDNLKKATIFIIIIHVVTYCKHYFCVENQILYTNYQNRKENLTVNKINRSYQMG